MKRTLNSIKIEFPALAENEALARSCICAFAAQADPTAGELADIRCAVSEAVTNAVVHAYGAAGGRVYISAEILEGRKMAVRVRDRGRGIPDIALAMTPLYTTDSNGERSGMGFAIMKSFTDILKVTSKEGKGTSVLMIKALK